MTKEKLLELIEQYPDDCEIRFASQPAWPFEYSIEDIHFQKSDNDIGDDMDTDTESTGIIYLVEGRQIGYLPGNVSKELGWR